MSRREHHGLGLGLEVDLAWRNGRATSAILKATVARRHGLRASRRLEIDGPDTVDLKAGETQKVKFR